MAPAIKRSQHLIQLSREHHFSLLFCWKIRTGIKKQVELERITDYVHHFCCWHLIPHFQQEDILFGQAEDALVQRAYREHQLLHERIDKLRTATPAEQPALLSEIADLVDQHVHFEESELFPHLEQALEDTQLAVIAKQLAQAHPEPLQGSYQDEFWV